MGVKYGQQQALRKEDLEPSKTKYGERYVDQFATQEQIIEEESLIRNYRKN